MSGVTQMLVDIILIKSLNTEGRTERKAKKEL